MSWEQIESEVRQQRNGNKQPFVTWKCRCGKMAVTAGDKPTRCVCQK